MYCVVIQHWVRGCLRMLCAQVSKTCSSSLQGMRVWATGRERCLIAWPSTLVSAPNLPSLWAAADKSQSHPLLLILRAWTHLIWWQRTSTALFPVCYCCSWSSQPTDFDRRPWWEWSIALSRGEWNGEQRRQNWDTWLSLSRWIQDLTSAWQKAVSIHQALKRSWGIFAKLQRKGRTLHSKRKYSTQFVTVNVFLGVQ